MGKPQNENRAIWEKRITEQEVSGLSREAWCVRQGVKYSTYRYWRETIGKLPSPKKLHAPIPVVPSTPTWLEVSTSPIVPIPASSEPMVVRIGEVMLELRRGFDPELLRDIVRALVTI